MSIAAVRWIGLFRRDGRWDGASALRAEIASRDERPAEPIWRGRSLIVEENPWSATLGLGYQASAIVRAWPCDSWSEYEHGPHGVRILRADAVPVSLRSGRRRDEWLRVWHRGSRPDHHGEVVLRSGARPVCIVLAAGPLRGLRVHDREIVHERRRNARAVALEIADEYGLPIREIGAAWRDE